MYEAVTSAFWISLIEVKSSKKNRSLGRLEKASAAI